MFLSLSLPAVAANPPDSDADSDSQLDGLARGEDCPEATQYSPPRPLIPELRPSEDQRPIDSAFVGMTESWRDYAKAIRNQALSCRRDGDSVSWYRDHERIRTYWPAEQLDVYLKDGEVNYVINLGDPDMEYWEYYENGAPKYVESKVISRFHFYQDAVDQ